MANLFTELFIIKHAGQHGQKFEMILAGFLRHNQGKQQINRLLVNRVEINALFESDKGGTGVVAILETTVWNSDTIPDTGAAESFS
jgi:hypothetical protein